METTAQENEEFFTVEEMAEKLKMSTRTIRRHIKAGNITYFKLGREFRIPVSEIERLTVPRKKTI